VYSSNFVLFSYLSWFIHFYVSLFPLLVLCSYDIFEKGTSQFLTKNTITFIGIVEGMATIYVNMEI
jgi:hypothetical protein